MSLKGSVVIKSIKHDKKQNSKRQKKTVNVSSFLFETHIEHNSADKCKELS